MRVKILAGVLISTAVLAFTHHSNAQEKIEVSTSCFDDFLRVYWAVAYSVGFDTVWRRAHEEMERMEANIYDADTEIKYNGAIQITNDIICLYREDETMQGLDKLFGRIEGRYDLPEGDVLHSLEQRIRNSDC